MPKGTPNETCGDHGGTNRRSEPCGRAAGWGTPDDSGRCRRHRGTSPDGSSHAGNTNAVSHGAYVETNSFYQDVIDDELRAVCDDIFSDYMAAYEARHGEPPLGHEMELFRIAVSHVKAVYADNWATDRPTGLDSGNPMVDQEVHYSESGQKYHRYKETVVLAAQQKLSRDRRQWLKDLGLLEDPDSQKADATGDLASAIEHLAGERP